MRVGPPSDDPIDLVEDGRWAGVLPVRQVFGAPLPCPTVAAERKAPDHVVERFMTSGS